jgi:hypothetical protein
VDNPRIKDDPRLRAQRVAELLLQGSLSDKEIDELACLLAAFFGFAGGLSRFICYLNGYRLEEVGAKLEQERAAREWWQHEHPEDRDRKVWTVEEHQRMMELWQQRSRN